MSRRQILYFSQKSGRYFDEKIFVRGVGVYRSKFTLAQISVDVTFFTFDGRATCKLYRIFNSSFFLSVRIYIHNAQDGFYLVSNFFIFFFSSRN